MSKKNIAIVSTVLVILLIGAGIFLISNSTGDSRDLQSDEEIRIFLEEVNSTLSNHNGIYWYKYENMSNNTSNIVEKDMINRIIKMELIDEQEAGMIAYMNDDFSYTTLDNGASYYKLDQDEDYTFESYMSGEYDIEKFISEYNYENILPCPTDESVDCYKFVKEGYELYFDIEGKQAVYRVSSTQDGEEGVEYFDLIEGEITIPEDVLNGSIVI